MPVSDVVVWLDFHSDDLVRAREFIKIVQDEAVLDELGFLALQTKFSDVFYPATSTQMGPCRYFYFISALYKQLERERLSSKNVAVEARTRMDELREVLAANESTGVIGRDAKEQVKQLPSTIHWAGLRHLGMFKAPIPETAYHGMFDETRAQSRGYSDDDKTPQQVARAEYWDSELPIARFLNAQGRFRDNTNFTLDQDEASDLAKRFQTRFPDSLLTFLLVQRKASSKLPWLTKNPTPFLSSHFRHAEALSLFARGVTLQYYQLVLEARKACNLGAPDIPIRTLFATWWNAAAPLLSKWQANELLTLPGFGAAARPGASGDLAFITSWISYLKQSDNADTLFDHDAARKLVRAREIHVKPTKARLKHRKHLQQWQVTKVKDTFYQFDYRHRIGARFVADILAGLGGAQ